MEKEEYLKLVEEISPTANLKKNLFFSFSIGGLICMFGEALRLLLIEFFVSEKQAGVLVSVILIFLTAIATGLGFFYKIAAIAGAGTFVPITGFSNSIVSPALEFKTEGFILGVASKMFVIAGPVIVYGTIASIVCGIFFYFFSLLGVEI